MQILLNGTPHELSAPTLRAALERLSLSENTRHVAIAVNEAVVPRARWDEVVLDADARVEIITAVAGG